MLILQSFMRLVMGERRASWRPLSFSRWSSTPPATGKLLKHIRCRKRSLKSNNEIILTFVVSVACALSCGFSILFANDASLAAESPSEESSSKSSEKPDVTPDAEGFYGVPDAVIDDPDGYVNLRKEKSADSPIVAKVKKDEPFEFEC